jgi:integrase
MIVTDSFLRGIQKNPPEKKKSFHDSRLPRFMARARPSGKISWVVRFGKIGNEVVIGDWPAMNSKQAFEAACAVRLKILNGVNVTQEKRRAKIGTTIEVLALDYLRCLPESSDLPSKRSHVHKRIIPSIGKLDLLQATRHDVSVWFADYSAKAPIQANRCLSTLNSIFAHAKRRGIIPEEYRLPWEGLKRNPENERERVVTETEWPRLFDAISKTEDWRARCAVLLLIFTPLRLGKVLAMDKNRIDLAGRRYIEGNPKDPNGTAKSEVVVHDLNDEAMEVIEEIMHDNPSPSRWLFPSDSKTGHLTHIRRSWETIKKRAGIFQTESFGLWIHDLKRSWGSYAIAAGMSDVEVQKAMGHKSQEASRRYRRLVAGWQTKRVSQSVGKIISSYRKGNVNGQ